MAADFKLHPHPLEFLCNIEIIEDGSILGIMVYENTLLPSFKASEPLHTLLREKGRGHSHVRTAAAPQESPALLLEGELFIAEDLTEGIAAAFRPFCIMIAGDHIIIQAERIQHHLDSGKLIVGAEVGNVPAHYHKV